MSRAVDLVFDLDGTISDPLLGIHRCMNHALNTFGYEEVTGSTVAKFIGPQLDVGFRSLLPDENETRIRDLVSRFRQRYAQIGYAENSIYVGMAETLNQLHRSGWKIGLCTSKRVDFAEKILELFSIRNFFTFVDGGDVGVHKSDQ